MAIDLNLHQQERLADTFQRPGASVTRAEPQAELSLWPFRCGRAGFWILDPPHGG
jgi:hypothetical protein